MRHQGLNTALHLLFPLQSSCTQDNTISTKVQKGGIDPLRSAIVECHPRKHLQKVEASHLTCCSSSAGSWWSSSCFGWGSPPWQRTRPSALLQACLLRCSVRPFHLSRFTSAYPPDSLAQSPTAHSFSWLTCYHYLTNQPLLTSSFLCWCCTV